MTADVTPLKRPPGRPRKQAAPKTAVLASAARVEYRVLRNVEHPNMQQVLNEQAAAGWRLHSFTAAHGGYLCVFER